MHNQPLYAHFVELPLWSGESLAGSGCFCWKSNWTKFDHVGTTGGNWETISGSFSISFWSKLEVQSQCVPFIVLTPWYPLCAHFVELPLWSVEISSRSGCFCWKSNWTKFDQVENTGGHWETTVAAFLLSPSGDLGIGLVWDNHPTHRTTTFQSDCWNPLQTELNYLWGVLSCSQDDIRWV